MAKLIESFTNHLTNWGLVWFCFIFWGSIFNAILVNTLNFESSNIIYFAGYTLGLIFGIFAKYKNWGWVN